MAFPIPVAVTDLTAEMNSSNWDALIVIGASFSDRDIPQITSFLKTDQRIGQNTVGMVCEGVPGNRLILAPTGMLDRDIDDVRRFEDAAGSAILEAQALGSRSPLIWVKDIPSTEVFQNASEATYLGLTQALWQPLEARERLNESEIEPIETIGIYSEQPIHAQWLKAIESGRRVARDLCGTEPERMSPPHFAEYCEQAFEGTSVKVTVNRDLDSLTMNYPLLMSVARASKHVERHHPRVIRLEYTPEGPIEETLMFAGKGLTYDTGGADLKVDGHMAGMSRDKGGAAAVAGFVKTAAELGVKGVKIIAEIGAVRNSIGSDAFVTDEICTSHAGVRVRIGNTDAEGRLVMADLLSHLRENALEEVNPQLFTVATLTGHAAIALGPYTALVENGPSRAQRIAAKIADAGEVWGDPCELSRVRREDYEMIAPKTKADDVLSCNNAPSSRTPRGHQFPMAFMDVAAGLDKHGLSSQQPIPYIHIDIAGSGVEKGDWQHDKPTAAPLTALAAAYLKNKA